VSELPPTRRQLLAAGVTIATAATAGCLGSLSGGDGAESSDSEQALTLSLSSQGGPLRERYVRDLAETRADWDEEAFEAARNGETYTTQYRTPFLTRAGEPTYAEHEGTFYELASVVVDEAEATHPVLRLSEVETTEEGNDAVPASELPESDRRAVEVAYFAARARGNEGGVPWGLVQRAGAVFRREEAIEGSELLADDGPDRVSFRDRIYAVSVSRETFYEPVYRATVEPVAEDPDQLETILRAQVVDARMRRDELSDAAQDVLLEAEGEGYRETHPFSEAFQEVLKKMHKRAYLDGNIRKDAGVREEEQEMVLYDGEYYDYGLRFVSVEE
jgi:hypothetical protein